MTSVAAVVIGRNEADKLQAALTSVLSVAHPVVYVDSGSSDGSSELARSLAADVVDLDPAKPFSVARARNEGFRRALALAPGTQLVQFVDADSEICPAWFAVAGKTLEEDAGAATAFGRLREREPRRSIFNRLYQAEFDAHFLQRDACPGMSMVRIRAIVDAGGFVESLTGFEDTELSFRFRQAGWRVVRLDVDMAVHEARMGTARQWWSRQLRSGFARGQERARYAAAGYAYGARESWSVWAWGFLLPAFIAVAALPTHGWSLLLLAAYLAMTMRIRRRYLQANPSFASPGLYAASLMLGKVPQAVGLARFTASRMLGVRPKGRLV